MAVVLDFGSDTTKVGFSGEDGPSVVIPTVVGFSDTRSPNKEIESVGPEALESIINGRQEACLPISHGTVSDWDAIEAICNYLFTENLQVASGECDVVLADVPMNSKRHRERFTQMMFETFNVSGFFVASTAVLSLYPVRRTSGLVVTSGDGATHCVPVYDGATLPHGVLRFDGSGSDLTEFIGLLLDDKGCVFKNTFERYKCAQEIKESMCYVAENFAEEMAAPVRQEKYTLPDKNVIKIDKERCKCCEAYFQPFLADKHDEGIQKRIFQSINRCDEELHNELYENIVLSGGSTLFPYLPNRLQKEVSLLAPSKTNVNVVAKQGRQNAAWIGGSILSEMSTFQNMIILREDYDEYGPSVVRRKC